MDVFNRPPTISEDTLQFTVHPSSSFPDKSTVTALAVLINSHVSSLLPDHIWHKDTFEVKVVNESSNKNSWKLEGRMRVGDCVDDEWCVVWLLRNVSQRWDVAISLFDSDGDFLLIEAANYLPTWITPTNSENRVWIYNGRLHIVPLQYISKPPTTRERRRTTAGSESDDDDGQGDLGYVSPSDAVALVRDAQVDTLAAPDVEQSAFKRTEGYPELARQHLHRTKVFVPVDIALALQHNHSLIQKATEAFYTRDAFQLRAAARMARFPPDSSVLTTVTMTRTAYAQLMGQRFHPPKIFGLWKEKEGTPEWRWRDIGMKIACGFEMVYQESKNRHGAGVDAINASEASAEARIDGLRRDPEYVRYMQDLQKAGFFKGEIQDSALWGKLESRAAAQFIFVKQPDNANRPSFASMVDFAISQAAQVHGGLHQSHDKEDSDGWLTVDEATVDNLLFARSESSSIPQDEIANSEMDIDVKNLPTDTPEDKQAAKQASQLHVLANKVGSFVEAKGDMEGAIFEDDLLSDESDMLKMSDSDDESASDWNTDANIPNSERQAAMDRLVPALEPSEYGVMPPSFHSNSQRVKKDAPSLEDEQTEGLQRQTGSPQMKSARHLIFPRDQFDGVEDSDDESEDEGDEDEEDGPTIVGEVDVDMQAEEEEFLAFSREMLGITPEMWKDIVEGRRERGAFLPSSVIREESSWKSDMSSQPIVSIDTVDTHQGSDTKGSESGQSKLDSFEAVMQALDAELSRARQGTRAGKQKAFKIEPSSKRKSDSKGKQKANEDDETDMDVNTAMETELRATLQESSDEEVDEAPVNFTLMKNFLESFKSQQGLSGPVSNLIGRLGGQLPRDNER